jgi:hypothetical protein
VHSLAGTAWVTWTLDEVQPGLCRVRSCTTTSTPAADGPADDAWHQVVGGLKTVVETGRALIG